MENSAGTPRRWDSNTRAFAEWIGDRSEDLRRRDLCTNDRITFGDNRTLSRVAWVGIAKISTEKPSRRFSLVWRTINFPLRNRLARERRLSLGLTRDRGLRERARDRKIVRSRGDRRRAIIRKCSLDRRCTLSNEAPTRSGSQSGYANEHTLAWSALCRSRSPPTLATDNSCFPSGVSFSSFLSVFSSVLCLFHSASLFKFASRSIGPETSQKERDTRELQASSVTSS